MSITLPPLPESPHHGDFTWGEVRAFATTYATAAVEADRASRVPMPDEQLGLLLLDNYSECPVETIFALGRALEAHHGIGVKP